MPNLRIQLWSYNYDPEPSGIAPLSTAWAKAMAARGHEVEVVAAHPHYPEPRWGRVLRPYRETRDGIRLLRLPIWVGRSTSAQRIRQELGFALTQTAALPALGSPDAIVAVSPSFPALLPAIANARLRRIPWVLWLQDLLPDGAATTGIIEGGVMLDAARWLERKAYREADHIIVISETFRENLLAKGVPDEKISRIYNWATRPLGAVRPPADAADSPRVLCMGNIGHSQGLAEIVKAFEADASLAAQDAQLVLAGTGVAAEDVRQAIVTDRVQMTGLLFSDALEEQLRRATLGAVTQHYDGSEFNVPSKLMNYLASGLPVVASVAPDSEVARIIETSGAGWVTNASEPREFAATVANVLTDREELARRGAAGLEFARREFTPAGAAAKSEHLISAAVRRSGSDVTR